MRRIILFRFHKNLPLCKNRLKLLKRYNPHIKIFGLFGGNSKSYKLAKKKLKPYIENIYFIKEKDKDWKWKNSDLAIKLWYNDFGRELSFDILHIIEWDLLLFNSLDKVYRHIPKNGIGLTGLISLKKVEKKWSWTSKEPEKTEWKNLLNFVKQKFNYKKNPYASLGPGLCLPKNFLKKYSKKINEVLC